MLHLKGALLGIAAFVGLVLGIVIAAVYLGFAPMAADTAPSAMEASLAMKAVHAVSEREMGHIKDPLPLTEANLSAGLKTYQQNCLLCHGASDGKASNAAAGFYVPSPQFATDGAEDDPEGATFWKIHHGIRFTGMPAFHKTLDDAQIWQVAMFLKNMDRLPSPIANEWRATPSVGGAQSRTIPSSESSSVKARAEAKRPHASWSDCALVISGRDNLQPLPARTATTHSCEPANRVWPAEMALVGTVTPPVFAVNMSAHQTTGRSPSGPRRIWRLTGHPSRPDAAYSARFRGYNSSGHAPRDGAPLHKGNRYGKAALVSRRDRPQ